MVAMKQLTLVAALLVSSALAQTSTPAPVKLAEASTVAAASLSLNAAHKIAMQAVQNCADA